MKDFATARLTGHEPPLPAFVCAYHPPFAEPACAIPARPNDSRHIVRFEGGELLDCLSLCCEQSTASPLKRSLFVFVAVGRRGGGRSAACDEMSPRIGQCYLTHGPNSCTPARCSAATSWGEFEQADGRRTAQHVKSRGPLFIFRPERQPVKRSHPPSASNSHPGWPWQCVLCSALAAGGWLSTAAAPARG